MQGVTDAEVTIHAALRTFVCFRYTRSREPYNYILQKYTFSLLVIYIIIMFMIIQIIIMDYDYSLYDHIDIHIPILILFIL